MKVIRKADEMFSKLLPKQKPKPGVRYIPSQFVLSFDHNGKKIGFNTLTRQCLEADLPSSAYAGEGCDRLIEDLFLVPEGKDECAFYEAVSFALRSFNQKPGIREFTITTTLGCNARCIYCYEEDMKQVTMTPEIADQTVRYIMGAKQAGKITLAWFGGEPLLCVPIIDRICASLRDRGVDFNSTMISNGSLITPDVVGKMIDRWNLDRIQISMDGAEQDYYARKNYRVRDDQYHAVLHAIGLMADKGIRVKVRCNVDSENIDRIPVFLQDLKNNVPHYEKISFYLAPLFAERTGPDSLQFWKKLLEIRSAYETDDLRIGGLTGVGNKVRINNCIADGNSVVIHPDGSLYSCEQFCPNSRFGDVWNGTTDEAAKKEFCRTDRTREKCRRCPFLPQCTSFSNCPIQENRCREMRELLALDTLHRMLDGQTDKHAADEDELVC